MTYPTLPQPLFRKARRSTHSTVCPAHRLLRARLSVAPDLFPDTAEAARARPASSDLPKCTNSPVSARRQENSFPVPTHLPPGLDCASPPARRSHPNDRAPHKFPASSPAHVLIPANPEIGELSPPQLFVPRCSIHY